MNNVRTLIVIAGPTAVGKTDTALKLAEFWKTEIISADSRQIYREMAIGTAKPSLLEQGGVVHHFVDKVPVTQRFTAADFEKNGLKVLNNIFETRQVAICAGGTGLYIKALCEGFDQIPDVPESFIDAIQEECLQVGLQSLVEELKIRDPKTHQNIDLSNPHRVQRALSVSRYTGKPYSSFLASSRRSRDFKSIRICLDLPREVLYARIEKRVDKMIEDGLEEEVRSLQQFKSLRPLQTVGYSEFFDHFDGLMSRKEAIAKIKQNSRRYAKRQLTWFRNQGDYQFIDALDDQLIGQIIKIYNDSI